MDEIKRKGGCAAFFQADLSQPEQVRLIVPFTLETFGRPDFAFNNAATSGENALLVDQTEANFDRVFNVNVKALFLLLQDELKHMVAQEQGGSIANAASVSGLLATPTAGHYVASKHAVLGLTKTAAVEYGKYGIRVNAVSPGAVRTEMLLDVSGTEEALDRMSAVHPLGRIGCPWTRKFLTGCRSQLAPRRSRPVLCLGKPRQLRGRRIGGIAVREIEEPVPHHRARTCAIISLMARITTSGRSNCIQ